MKSALLIVGLVASAFGADVRVVEEIIAKVNGEVITKGQIEHNRQLLLLEMKERRLTPAQMKEGLEQHDKDALRDQIDQLLLIQKAKELNLNVDTDVSKRVAQMQLDNRMADPDQFQKWIHDQFGMTFEDFKLQLKNSILVQRVLDQEIGSRISISKTEIAKYYEEHKKDFVRQEQVFLREIFLSTEGKTPEQVAAIEKKAKDLAARARKGEKFPEMARENSDADSAKNYGELPPFKKGDLKKEIEDIVFKQQRGYITDPLRQSSPGGFLILKVEEHWAAGQATVEDVMPEIQQRLFEPRFQPQIRTYLTRLRRDAFLEVREGYLDSGAAQGKDTRWADPGQLTPQTVKKAEVLAIVHKKRLLWMIPITGTATTIRGKTRN